MAELCRMKFTTRHEKAELSRTLYSTTADTHRDRLAGFVELIGPSKRVEGPGVCRIWRQLICRDRSVNDPLVGHCNFKALSTYSAFSG